MPERMGSLIERNPSVWIATSDAPARAPLPGDTETEVLVIGGGITGLSTALTLKERGLQVMLIEAGAVAGGVTGYTTAKITALHGLVYAHLRRHHGAEKTRLYADANAAAIEQVARWVDKFGIDCDFERQDAYTYTTDRANVRLIQDEVAAAAEAGLPATLEPAGPLPFPIAAAVRVANQAQFHPRRYCLALADAVGTVYENTRALDIDDGEQVVVKTDRGTIKAGSVVVATHLPMIQRGLFYAKAHPTRSYAISVRLDGRLPDGMHISAEQPTRSVRRWGDLLIVGGQGHRVGEGADLEANYTALESWARVVFPVRSVEHRWSAQDYTPMDSLPYIGRASRGARNVYVATGFKKWGMTTGTFAGAILADLIMGRDNPWLQVFDATKLNPIESAKEAVTGNATVAKHFVLDRAHPHKKLDEVAPGEGAIVRHAGEKLACFRDEQGAVHAVSPVCTHMGCLVAFNDAERTWDCPCHGSRFGLDGRVLQGPAVKDLEQKSVREQTPQG